MPKIKTVRGIENRKVVSQKDGLSPARNFWLRKRSSRNCATN